MSERRGLNRTALVAGVLFVLLGTAFLLDELGAIELELAYFLPLLLIVAGLAVLLGGRRGEAPDGWHDVSSRPVAPHPAVTVQDEGHTLAEEPAPVTRVDEELPAPLVEEPDRPIVLGEAEQDAVGEEPVPPPAAPPRPDSQPVEVVPPPPPPAGAATEPASPPSTPADDEDDGLAGRSGPS